MYYVGFRFPTTTDHPVFFPLNCRPGAAGESAQSGLEVQGRRGSGEVRRR